MEQQAWTLIGSGGSERPATTEPRADLGSAPSRHPSCQSEGQRSRPAWQEEEVPAIYHGVQTGVPLRPVDDTEEFHLEEEGSGK